MARLALAQHHEEDEEEPASAPNSWIEDDDTEMAGSLQDLPRSSESFIIAASPVTNCSSDASSPALPTRQSPEVHSPLQPLEAFSMDISSPDYTDLPTRCLTKSPSPQSSISPVVAKSRRSQMPRRTGRSKWSPIFSSSPSGHDDTSPLPSRFKTSTLPAEDEDENDLPHLTQSKMQNRISKPVFRQVLSTRAPRIQQRSSTPESSFDDEDDEQDDLDGFIVYTDEEDEQDEQEDEERDDELDDLVEESIPTRVDLDLAEVHDEKDEEDEEPEAETLNPDLTDLADKISETALEPASLDTGSVQDAKDGPIYDECGTTLDYFPPNSIKPRKISPFPDIDPWDINNDHIRPPIFTPKTPRQPRLEPPVKRTPTVQPSPSKHVLARQRKAFENTRQQLAEDYVALLDTKVTKSKISRLTASSGGIKIEWSKNLRTTAGTARAYREGPDDNAIELLSESDFKPSAGTKYIAQIKLSTKVCDDEQKTMDTIAHEYCHLLVDLLDCRGKASDTTIRAHGPNFKLWGKKVSKVMELGAIDRCHSYKIQFKYAWECQTVACKQLIEKHSKSFDTDGNRCGRCKGRFVQIRPTPRKALPTQYQLFVKDQYSSVVETLPRGSPKKVVMLELGRWWREEKSKTNVVEAQENNEEDSDNASHAGQEATSIWPMAEEPACLTLPAAQIGEPADANNDSDIEYLGEIMNEVNLNEKDHNRAILTR